MIKPSEYGFIIRRETDPLLREVGGEYVMSPAEGRSGLTPEMLEMGRRIFSGIEPVDVTDSGWQVTQ